MGRIRKRHIPNLSRSRSPSSYFSLVVRNNQALKKTRHQDQDLAEIINNKTDLQRLCVLGLSENVIKLVFTMFKIKDDFWCRLNRSNGEHIYLLFCLKQQKKSEKRNNSFQNIVAQRQWPNNHLHKALTRYSTPTPPAQ